MSKICCQLREIINRLDQDHISEVEMLEELRELLEDLCEEVEELLYLLDENN